MHMFLRDAASAMQLATDLLDEDSMDCFGHKVSLAVREGLAEVTGLMGKDGIVARIHRLVRKTRKSHVQRTALKDLQMQLDLGDNSLISVCTISPVSFFNMPFRTLRSAGRLCTLCWRGFCRTKKQSISSA